MTSKEEETKRAYALVGELVLIAAALDQQLNRICIAVLALVDSPMLEPLVASVDSARKIEILKAYATKITAKQWKKGLNDHARAVEAVNRWRNIAAHSVMAFDNGKAVLEAPAAAKIIKTLDLTTKKAEKVDLGKLEDAIHKGEAAYNAGITLLQNFERVRAARARRAQQTGSL